MEGARRKRNAVSQWLICSLLCFAYLIATKCSIVVDAGVERDGSERERKREKEKKKGSQSE